MEYYAIGGMLILIFLSIEYIKMKKEIEITKKLKLADKISKQKSYEKKVKEIEGMTQQQLDLALKNDSTGEINKIRLELTNKALEKVELARRALLPLDEQKKLLLEDEKRLQIRKQEIEKQNNEFERKRYLTESYGAIIPALICPHCQEKKCVRRKLVLSAELMLSKSHTYKQREQTQMWCQNCETKWIV